MILIFFLCLKLSVLHLCVSDPGYQCTGDDTDIIMCQVVVRTTSVLEVILPNSKYTWEQINRATSFFTHYGISGDSEKPNVYLIQENNTDVASVYRKTLNDAFIMYCEDYYEIYTGPLNRTNSDDYIVYFAVPDYNDEKPLKNFVYAGNVTKYGDATCINKTYHIDKPVEYDCHEFGNFVSKSVFEVNDGHLHNFVQAMEYKNEKYVDLMSETSCEPMRKTSELTAVILCLPKQDTRIKQRKVHIKDLELIQVLDDECPHYLNSKDDYSLNYELRYHFDFPPFSSEKNPKNKRKNQNQNRLLAVLAPKPYPYETISHSLVPTIFYETPYMYSAKKNDFPNSMNLVPWRLLKYGFLKFIQSVGWQRVAIVSDDSEYSVAFEDELSALFRKQKDIVYTVIRCEDTKCDMGKIAKKLNTAGAWIVIANVEEKNARFLIKHTNHWFTWLLRDMSGSIQELINNQIAFTFSLHIDKIAACGVEDNILTSLSGIAQAYENTKTYASTEQKHEFYRRFAKELQRVTPRITEAQIVIKRTTNTNSREISKYGVDANGIQKVIHYENPFPNGQKPRDRSADCLVATYDYYKPCEDPLVLLLMFTLLLFVLTILLITCYFDKTSPFNDVRYQNF